MSSTMRWTERTLPWPAALLAASLLLGCMPESDGDFGDGEDPEATSTEPGLAANVLTPSYPSTCHSPFSVYSQGETDFCFTWYNRSVGVNGSVEDFGSTRRASRNAAMSSPKRWQSRCT
jgi:hypothetical protein